MDKLRFEVSLLEMWYNAKSFDKIYKYKNRIRAFRQPLTNIELFYDLSHRMFEEIQDTADGSDYYVKDCAVEIKELLDKKKSELDRHYR